MNCSVQDLENYVESSVTSSPRFFFNEWKCQKPNTCGSWSLASWEIESGKGLRSSRTSFHGWENKAEYEGELEDWALQLKEGRMRGERGSEQAHAHILMN